MKNYIILMAFAIPLSIILNGCKSENKDSVIVKEEPNTFYKDQKLLYSKKLYRPFGEELERELVTSLDTVNRRVFILSLTQHEVALHLAFKSDSVKNEVRPILDAATVKLDEIISMMSSLNTKENPDLSKAKEAIEAYNATDTKLSDYLSSFRIRD